MLTISLIKVAMTCFVEFIDKKIYTIDVKQKIFGFGFYSHVYFIFFCKKTLTISNFFFYILVS